jgi:O-antigen ligase
MRALRLRLPQWNFDAALPIGIGIVAALGIGPLIVWAITEESWRLLTLVLLAALSPIALRWPVTVAFGAYAFVLPFDSVGVVADTGGATVTRLVGIVTAGVLLAAGVVQQRMVRPPVAALWVGLLFLWGIMTLAWAVNLELAQGRLVTVVSLVAMYLAAVSFRVSEEDLRTVCVLTMLGGALAATAGVILGFEADGPRVARGTLAVAGLEANPNGVAQSLMLPLAMAAGLFLGSRRISVKAIAIAGVGAIGAGIFLTMSRASLAAVIMMIGVFLYRFRVRWQVLAIPGILGAVLPLMPDLFFERVGAVFSGQDATGAGRTEIWKVSIDALERFGWFGAGLSNHTAAYAMYAPTPPGGLSRSAHNTFLGTWVELGAVGLALLLVVFFVHLRTSKRSNGSTAEIAFPAAIEAACFGFLVIAFFGDVLWRKAVWMPWILAVWASRIRAEDQKVD